MTPLKEYREIPLSNGHVAIVDASDYEWLSQWKWSAMTNGSRKTLYAVRNSPVKDGRKSIIYMHREIIGLPYGDKRRGDHIINGDTLNNRRSNLRIASVEENSFNSVAHRDNSSGYKGVSWGGSRDKRWIVQVRAYGENVYRKGFRSLVDAAQIYMLMSFIHHKDFSYSGKALQ